MYNLRVISPEKIKICCGVNHGVNDYLSKLLRVEGRKREECICSCAWGILEAITNGSLARGRAPEQQATCYKAHYKWQALKAAIYTSSALCIHYHGQASRPYINQHKTS